ncbi:hypothetical protein [Thermoanaerobacterium sp. DL9XJH110]|uniref:hypothetical protein n=1 Tax=Thermoanaerobacterium sp. DL9XJH110 TaxID=3386643 RepID=UPI003BB67E0D
MLNVFKYAEERGKREGFLEALNKHSRAKSAAFSVYAAWASFCGEDYMWGWQRFSLADGAIFRRSDTTFRQLGRKNRQLDKYGRRFRSCREYFIT